MLRLTVNSEKSINGALMLRVKGHSYITELLETGLNRVRAKFPNSWDWAFRFRIESNDAE